MYNRIKRRVQYECFKFKAKLFKYLLRKYPMPIYFKEKHNILTERDHTDNWEHALKYKTFTDSIALITHFIPLVKPQSIGIDIGANEGITTVAMARVARKVIAFEPIPENQVRFKENLAVNGIKNVVLEDLAVSKNCGSASINIHAAGGHHSFFDTKVSSKIETREVKTITLDKYCRQSSLDRIGFLKIDVEGAEILVLQGASELLTQKKIENIVFEHSPFILNNIGRPLDEVYQYLKQYGYVIKDYQFREISEKEILILKQCDLLATLAD